MALTYYIRSWDPRSTYPTNPQEGDICYTITLDQTWAPVGGVKKDNIVKEEIYQSGAWVEQGGGGSSDFTTAKITVNSERQTSAMFPFAASMQGMEFLSPTSMISQGSSEFDAVLYKGMSMFMLANDATDVEISSVSGDAEQMGPAVMISGDCTINITRV